MFAQIAQAPPPAAIVEPEKAPDTRPVSSVPSYRRGEFGNIRLNERDSMTTELRLASGKKATLDAANQLAEKHQLPPDQNLLLKVLGLKDKSLTRLALEELLELDDRGRVRPTEELRGAISGLRTRDRETGELRDLLLEKIGHLRV